jgi:hypothetical protein
MKHPYRPTVALPSPSGEGLGVRSKKVTEFVYKKTLSPSNSAPLSFRKGVGVEVLKNYESVLSK